MLVLELECFILSAGIWCSGFSFLPVSFLLELPPPPPPVCDGKYEDTLYHLLPFSDQSRVAAALENGVYLLSFGADELGETQEDMLVGKIASSENLF